MKYFLSTVLIVAALLAGRTLVPASAMAPTQFGTFSEGYLKRKAERAEQRKMRPPKPTKCEAPQECPK